MGNRLRRLGCLALSAASILVLARATSAQRRTDPGAELGAEIGKTIGKVLGGTGGERMGAELGNLVGRIAFVLVREPTAAVSSPLPPGETPDSHSISVAEPSVLSVRAFPAVVSQGRRVSVEATYAVKLPSYQRSAKVSETWELLKDDKLLVMLPGEVARRERGLWIARVSIEVPSDAHPGEYVVRAKVRIGSLRSESGTVFRVS